MTVFWPLNSLSSGLEVEKKSLVITNMKCYKAIKSLLTYLFHLLAVLVFVLPEQVEPHKNFRHRLSSFVPAICLRCLAPKMRGEARAAQHRCKDAN